MKMRIIKYKQALEEAYFQCMEQDPSIFIAGIGVDYSSAVFGSTTKIIEKYGKSRIFDTPAMENALTGISIGAAAMGKRPVIVHLRNDFMFLALDQLINLASKWKYMYGGNAGNLPIVVRGIIGRGWGQGATHSQSLHTIFGYFPGLHVVMPAFPADAKGLTVAALKGNTPTVILEHRTLYETEGHVAEECFSEEIGKARIVKSGNDLTVVAISHMAREAMVAAEVLEESGISIEVIDLRSIRPIDQETILNSVKKTGALLVVDNGWKMYGISSEIIAFCSELGLKHFNMPPRRLAWQDCPSPVTRSLEDAFYPSAMKIANEILSMLGKTKISSSKLIFEDNFTGPY